MIDTLPFKAGYPKTRKRNTSLALNYSSLSRSVGGTREISNILEDVARILEIKEIVT
jgi:hypothetical protein